LAFLNRGSVSLRLIVSDEESGLSSPGAHLLAESEDGDPVILGSFEQSAGEIVVADFATFRFRAGDDVVRAYVRSEMPRDAVMHSFHSTAVPLIAWAVDGLEVLHASAVRTPQGVIAISGHSGSGKTTIAHGLVQRGHERFAEDAVAFTMSPSAAHAVPLPFTVNLRASARQYFARAEVPAIDVVHAAAPDDGPLAAIFHLQPIESGDSAAPVLTRLQAPDALVCLLNNAYRFVAQPAERERRMFESYLRLAATTPVWRLTFSHGFEQFSALLDLVEKASRAVHD
jgi:hypothetical protein